MTTFFSQYSELLKLNLRMGRQFIWLSGMINIAFAIGLVVGFGIVIPEISDTTALFLITGAATQMITTVALVALPQTLGQAKAEGRLEYFFTLPISREAYLLAQVTFVFILVLPALIFAVVLGAWRFDVALSVDPLVLLVVPLAVLSLAGVGVTLAVVSSHQQLTGAITQLLIFYVLFFAPVLAPREALPVGLRELSDYVPVTYVADALRATLTDLPGTHVWRSIAVMAGFGVASLALAAGAVRRRT